MGKLAYLTDLNLDASWYFPDAHWGWERDTWYYQWPNPAWPYHFAIHSDDLFHKNDRKIAIRQWVEQSLSDTVIVDTVDKSYRHYISEEKDWDRSYEVTNKWVVFYFENEHSATMFSLRFSEWIQPITDRKPGHFE